MYQSGDVLFVKYPGFKHYGIYVGNGRVIHNSKKYLKVFEQSLEEFVDNKTVSVSSIKAENPAVAVQTAKKYLGVPYNLLSENCEHFVRLACGLEKESAQVQKYLISALGAGALLKSANPVVKAAGGAATVATLLTAREKSPVKNALVFSCMAAGVAYVVSRMNKRKAA